MKKFLYIILVLISARFIQVQVRDNLVLTNILYSGSKPTFTSDGDHIILTMLKPYSWSKIGYAWKMDLEGNLIEMLLVDVRDPFSPILSTDNQKIVYETSRDYEEGTQVWMKDIKTGESNSILNSKHADFILGFSSDRTKLLFKRADRIRNWHMGGKVWGYWDLYELDFSSRKEIKLTFQNYYGIGSGFCIGESIFFVSMDPQSSSMNTYIWKLIPGSSPKKYVGKDVSSAAYAPQAKTLMYWEDSKTAPRFRMRFLNMMTGYDEEVYATSNFLLNSSISSQGDKVLMLLEDWKDGGKVKLYLFDVKSNQIREIRPKWKQ